MILSKQNSLIKLIKSLSDKKNRDESGLYVVEGYKMVKEAISLGQEIFRVIVSESFVCKYSDKLDVLNFEEVSDVVFSYVSGEVSPQGILALVKKPLNEVRSPRGKCLFLDGVSDPANVGAIIRTAAASGFLDIYACDSADCFSQKAVRASMSGIFHVSVHVGSREDLLSKINLPIIVADMGGEDVFKSSFPKAFCLVIGNEARGVSERLKNLAKHTVKIPMQNQMESLNASVSAGILMYQLSKND